MKSWWPWRKKKSLHTLFSERLAWPHETRAGRPQAVPPVTQRLVEAHPTNAPGGFFVVNSECMICGVPHYFAPELMEWETGTDGRPTHCYFRKQPETELELIHAVKAVEGSCCGAVRYRGSDPEIIQKLKEARCGHLIDRNAGQMNF